MTRSLSTVHLNTERGFGGGESQTLLLARGLAARGHKVLVLAPPGSGLLERAAAAGLPVRPFSCGFEYSPLATLQLAAILRATRADALHLHTPHAVGFGPWAARLAGTRAVVASRRAFPRRRQGRWARWKWSRCDRIAAVSDSLRAELLRCGLPSGLVVTIHSGVDLGALAEVRGRDPRGEFGWPSPSLVVATVGNLHPVKGHARLLRAAAIVVREEPRVRFFVAGSGPERPTLEREIASLGLAGRFVLAGFRKDAVALLRDSDLFVLPSRAEGFPNALVEALALGVPAIASDAGGSVEVLGTGEEEAGVLVPAGSDEEGVLLARTILRVLGDGPLRKRLGAAGPPRAAFFSADRTVAETERLYRSILREDGSECPT